MLDVCTNSGFITTKMPNLRLRENLIEDIDPFSNDAKTVMKEMVRQLLSYHPKAGNFHLGKYTRFSKNVKSKMYILGCAKIKLFSSGTIKKILKERETSSDIAYLDHVHDIGVFMRETFDIIRPVIWADTVDSMQPDILMDHKLADFVDVVIHSDLNDISLGKI